MFRGTSISPSTIVSPRWRAGFFAACFTAIALATIGCGVHFNGFVTVAVTPSTLSWHKVAVGHTSGAQQVTIKNTSTVRPVTISSITLSTNFIQTANNCPVAPVTMGAGASCTVSVAFRPVDASTSTGALTIADTATSSPQVVTLSATASVGSLLFTPASLTFPGVPAGSISQPQTAKLTNEASSPATLVSIVAGAHFSQGNNCPAEPDTLAAGESCEITATYQPSSSDASTSAVNVKDSFGNVTQLYLSGSATGSPVVGSLSFSPSTLVWGKVAVGATSGTKTLEVTNTQSSSVSFTDLSASPGYIISSSTCPVGTANLAGGASCTVLLAFRPESAGLESGALTFSDSAADSPQRVSLGGTGVLGSLLFAPTSLFFESVAPGAASPAQSATLTNLQSSPLSIASVKVSGHFAQGNNCQPTLASQASCLFKVTSNPVITGATSGSINVVDGSGSTTQLYLKGTGGNSTQNLTFSPDTLTWGKIAVGQTSGTKKLTVNNGQSAPLTIASITLGEDFVQTSSSCPTAPQTVAAGASCTIGIAFRPTSSATVSEAVTFSDDAPGASQSIPLSGQGTIGSLLFSPTALAFPGVNPGSVSQPLTATVTNTLTTNLPLTSITVSGHFAQTNNCPETLTPQASCSFTVTSDPLVDGAISGSVNIKDGTGATTQLYLSGTGGIATSSLQPAAGYLRTTREH